MNKYLISKKVSPRFTGCSLSALILIIIHSWQLFASSSLQPLKLIRLSSKCSEISQSIEFYQNIIGLDLIETGNRNGINFAQFKIDDLYFELVETDSTLPIKMEISPLSHHLAFMVSDENRIKKHLNDHGTKHLSTMIPACDLYPKISQLFIHDPDGHLIEFIYFDEIRQKTYIELKSMEDEYSHPVKSLHHISRLVPENKLTEAVELYKELGMLEIPRANISDTHGFWFQSERFQIHLIATKEEEVDDEQVTWEFVSNDIHFIRKNLKISNLHFIDIWDKGKQSVYFFDASRQSVRIYNN